MLSVKLIAVLFIMNSTVLAEEKSRFLLKDTKISVVKEGKKVYGTYCAVCHGKNLEGQPNWETFGADGRLPAPPHDESGHTWHHPDSYLVEVVLNGFTPGKNKPLEYESNMPAFKNILDIDQIISALSYIKSTWSIDYREWQENATRNDMSTGQ